jgi:uncharacterized membrane protein YdbT with pleckstrin-like domain
MAYPERLLNDFETVNVDLHPHWWFLAGPVSATAASLVLTIYSLTLGHSFGDKFLKYLATALLVISAGWLLVKYLKWVTTSFVVTSDRVIFREGVLRKDGIQIPLERVNNVNFGQSIFERILGAGDLLIESGGEDGHQRFTDIKHPDRITNIIHAAMEENGRPQQQSAAAPGGIDVASQLEKLEGLMQRGSISRDEYDAQKRKLLG